jgi:hypothetical protein
MEKPNRGIMLRDSFSSLYSNLETKINEILVSEKEDLEIYLLKSFPLSLTRKDGKEISSHILNRIAKEFGSYICQTPQSSPEKNHLTLVVE